VLDILSGVIAPVTSALSGTPAGWLVDELHEHPIAVLAGDHDSIETDVWRSHTL
jgi:hypothetical protein